MHNIFPCTKKNIFKANKQLKRVKYKIVTCKRERIEIRVHNLKIYMTRSCSKEKVLGIGYRLQLLSVLPVRLAL